MTKKFVPQQKNANKHTLHGLRLLEKSIQQDGFIDAQTAAADGEIISGSARLELSVEKFAGVDPIIVESDGTRPVVVVRTDIPDASDPRARRLSIAANQIGHTDWNPDGELLKEWGGEDEAIRAMFADSEWKDITGEEKPTQDAEVNESLADALRDQWNTELGQMWAIGKHRLFIGDCGLAENITRLMDGTKAAVIHADPPYGMGKESEGIANDNLYKEKLDLFQMYWWKACRPHLDDNGSAYIWGQADDLWRLWYRYLNTKDSERLTFRNEIVWEKQGAQGIGSEGHRQYPTASERCLFFMLGEQGFNVNASNYWDGWTPIVDYLEASRQAMGWSIKDTKRIAGHSENSGCHWFDKSQWSMPTREVYEAWQCKAESNDAFKREYDELKREYDELKREFYSTRAHFDNVHDNMTDVWHFARVTGDDRMGHATPKPVEMMERVIKSSAPDGAAVLVPFLGTGPEMVACENLGRVCYGLDVDAGYVALVLHRMEQAFPGIDIRRLE